MYDIFYLKKAGIIDGTLIGLRKRFPLIKVVEYDDDKFEALNKIKKKSLTRFFWVIDLDIDYQITDDFNFDYIVPDWDKSYVHIWKKKINNDIDSDLFGNVYLISKDYPFSKKEGKYFFFVNKKQIPIEASKLSYDILELKKTDNFYDEILSFQAQTSTSMFWVLAPECKLISELNYTVPDYDKEYVHQWTPINHESPNLFLIPKEYPISKRESDHLFFISKKEMEDKISKVGYDILELEFNDNFYDQINLFRAQTSTGMFWVLAPECKLLTDLKYLVPDYDKEYVHQWTPINHESPNLFLIPKEYPLSKREARSLFFISKKEMEDKISKVDYKILQLEIGDNFYNKITNFQNTIKTSMFWVLAPECKLLSELNYTVPNYDKEYVHQWTPTNHESPNLFLIPKDYPISKRESDHLFFISKKEMEDKISKVGYDILELDFNDNVYEKINSFQQKIKTSMLWVLAPECKLLTDLTYLVPDYDKEYVHQWTPINNESPNLFLIPKKYPLSKQEARHLFFISKKEMEDKISKVGYDILELEYNDNIYDCVMAFQQTIKTSMFWVLDSDSKLTQDLTYLVPDYDKEYVHQWTSSNNENSRLNLIPKNYPIAKKEANTLFFINKKEMNEELFKEVYDVIFISYNEPNADENWLNLLNRFPSAKRVHGIKGIHNAHKQAAKISTTSMFWVIDGDSQIVDDFNLDYVVNPWDKDSVFVWKSKNPVNNLIYGYGGVKLLPKQLTLELDTSTVDMTTSISNKFNSMDGVSNLTVFNTDPFNTWKSAFRECVKMSSKVIDGQVDVETENRLTAWCTVGYDKPYGEYSIKGALMGKEFGIKNSNNKSMLSKINDWEWLTNEFRKL